VANYAALHRLAQVVPQVPAVGYLDGLGSTGAGAIGVGAGTIAADNLDSGMGFEPVGQGGSLAVWQHVYESAGDHVQQDRPVDPALAQGEIVHTEHRDLANLRLGSPPQQPQQRVAADRHTQRGRQSRSWTAGQGDRDRYQGRP
jgi:hypothetical protein